MNARLFGRGPYFLGLTPALLVLGALTLAPALFLLVTSLTPLNLTRAETWFDFSRPLGNYREAFSDDRFLASIAIQSQLSVGTVVLQLGLGLGMALLVHGKSPSLTLRTLLLIPMVLPPIVVGIIWKVIFTPDMSPIYALLGYFGIVPVPVLSDASTALAAVIIAETWEWFPFTFLMVLAALQVMPQEPFEAASIDGASSWAQFRFITLPFILPTLIVAAIFRVVDSLKAFPLIYLLTGGGPGTATEVTNFYAFQQAFNYSYWGYASAIAVLLVAGSVALSVLGQKLLHASERWYV